MLFQRVAVALVASLNVVVAAPLADEVPATEKRGGDLDALYRFNQLFLNDNAKRGEDVDALYRFNQLFLNDDAKRDDLDALYRFNQLFLNGESE